MSLDAGFLILRVVIGGIFFLHGMQKLAGWFKGHGLRGFADLLQQAGVRPAYPWALAVALVEVSGLLLAAGLLTPVVAGALTANMLAAIALVHWKHGLWNAGGGYEYNLVLAAAAAAAGLTGGGRYAVDALFGDGYAAWAPALYAVVLVLGLAAFGASYGRARLRRGAGLPAGSSA